MAQAEQNRRFTALTVRPRRTTALTSESPPASCRPAPWRCFPRRGRSCRLHGAMRDTSDRCSQATLAQSRPARPRP
ncbi:hypothetical protein G6F54_014536 [Rhizopus delemar]|nr:hypothetical protein G6F54_014536 [Rhizopus delemar]